MATIKSSTVNAQGKVVVVYDDGNTRVITKDQATKEGIPFSSGPSNAPGTYGSGADGAFGDTVIDPATGQAISGTIMVPTSKGNISLTDLVLQSRNPTNLAKIKKDLISYGIISKGTKSLNSIQNAWVQVLVGAASSKLDPYDYLKQLKAGGFGQDVAQGATPYSQLTIYTPEKAQALVTQRYRELLNRQPTADELKKDTTDLIAQQKKSTSASKTTYKMVNGVNQSTTTTGFDENQYLTNKISGTKEYKTIQDQLNTSAVQQLKGIAADNGITLSPNQLTEWAKRLAGGESPEVIKGTIRNMAALGQPDSIKKLLAEGTDLATLYSPYKRIMASSLGINPETITLDDPTLRMAIGPDKEMSLYDYQKAIRKDNRWKYSQEANDEVTNMVNQVKRDFGFMG
jgi:hypothetical protein